MRTISRQPFGRYSVMRELIYPKKTTCSWCGGKNGYGGLYIYGFDRDDRPEIDWAKGSFCSLQCFKTYYNLEEI